MFGAYVWGIEVPYVISLSLWFRVLRLHTSLKLAYVSDHMCVLMCVVDVCVYISVCCGVDVCVYISVCCGVDVCVYISVCVVW